MSENNRASTDVDLFVGQKLKMLRLSANMTQADLGRAAGITFQQIQKYERGSNRIGASRLWTFCQIFSVEPSFFFMGLEKVMAYEPKPVAVRTGTPRIRKSTAKAVA